VDVTHLLVIALLIFSLVLAVLDRRDARRTHREISAVLERIEQGQERMADHTRHIADLVVRTTELAARNEALTRAVLLQVTGRETH
jgi:hypothetical protein